ncbi:hypothetical protein QQF64_009738 [Cirrhinus molitorella]
MVMLTGHLICGLPMGQKIRNPRAPSEDWCEPGYYKPGPTCSPCPTGFFTNQKNREERCHRCFQNCIPEFNMKEVKNCTSTSDVKCGCREGYVCSSTDRFTGQCETCVPVPTRVPSSTPADVPSSTTSTTSTISSTMSSITSSNERFENKDSYTGVVVWILCGLSSVMLSIFILTMFLRFCRKKEKECFKHFVRQCSLGNMEVDSETTPPTSLPDEQPHAQEMLSNGSTPTSHNTDCSFHQPISSEQAVPPAGNLGPLHIYGPQTVFVSLLNQFGWDSGEKKTHELQEESLNNTNMSYPQSPPVHLSEEEKSRENDFIFFPSQEQGKECHISKEEVL